MDAHSYDKELKLLEDISYVYRYFTLFRLESDRVSRRQGATERYIQKHQQLADSAKQLLDESIEKIRSRIASKK